MFILLPFFVWYFLFVWAHHNDRMHRYLFREKILFSFIGVCVLLTGITEVLSAVKQFTVLGLLISWGTVGFLLYRLISKAGWKLWPIGIRLDSYSEKMTSYVKVLLVGVLAIILITGLLAIFIPPNNWDAMFYRLPRVMHWIQNKTVDFYPTHITSQVYIAPWASFVLAHAQILSGGDYLANVVQWVFMVQTLIVTSLICMRLCGTLLAQITAVVFVATIPMGILQASSTQSDYITAFWLASLVYMGISAVLKKDIAYVVGTGFSIGLAIYTKSTALFFMAPFFLWFAYDWLSSQKLRRWKTIIIVASCATFISFGFFARNIQFSGKPIFTLDDYYLNQPLSGNSFLSSTVKNIALQFDSPFAPFNSVIYKAILAFHTHIGVEINAAGLIIPTTTFRLGSFVASEDFVANPLHVVLILLAVALLLVKRVRKNHMLVAYTLCVIVAFFVFTFFVRWQPWNSRLHLPIFILFAPAVMYIFDLVMWRRAVRVVIGILFLASLYYLFFNESKPIISFTGRSILFQSREELYFVERVKSMFVPYQQLGEVVTTAGYTNIGLVVASGDNEYGLWHVLQKGGAESSDRTHRRIKRHFALKYSYF